MSQSSDNVPKSSDVIVINTHPMGESRGCIIECRDQTMVHIDHQLDTSIDSDTINTIAGLAVQLQNVLHLQLQSHRVLPTVLTTKAELRRVLLLGLKTNEHTGDQAEIIDRELQGLGMVIDRIKQSEFDNLRTMDFLCIQLARMGVTKVESGGQSIVIDAETLLSPEQVSENARKTELLVRREHAHLEWARGKEDADQISQRTGFPVALIIEKDLSVNQIQDLLGMDIQSA